jgi:hypothetical protein
MLPARWIPPVPILFLSAAALAACAATSPLQQQIRSRLGDAVVESRGDRHVVSSRQGNLAEAAVFSPQERQAQLEGFINRYRSEFGVERVAPLEFVADGGELDFEQGGRLLVAVPLAQASGGYRILDRPQLGVFDLETGALTSAGMRLVDPASLTAIPAPKNREAVRVLAVAFLRGRGLVADTMTVSEDLAYSVEAGAAGFEVRCTSRSRPGALMRLRLLVHPERNAVVLVSQEEVDLAR